MRQKKSNIIIYKIHRIPAFIIFILIALLHIAGCSSDTSNNPTPPTNNVPAYVETQTQNLIAELESQGFEVSRGYFKLYTESDYPYSYEEMGSCYANNPAAPYIYFAVPPWKDEYTDPATKYALGKLYGDYRATFRFDPKEAIVIFGIMPPPAAYFGMQTYVFTREGSFNKDSVQYKTIAAYPPILNLFFATVPNNSKRLQLFSSIGNSNNNLVVNEQSKSSFDTERFFIVTPDQSMDAAIKTSLNKMGVGTDTIFTEPVPSVTGNLSTVKVGLNESSDELLWFMRYAMPYDGGGVGTASYMWRRNLPLVVLRIRDKKSGNPAVTYGPVTLDTRIAVDESGLAGDRKNLIDAVNSRWGQTSSGVSFIDLQSQFLLVGPECMKVGMNCVGDTQDTTYQNTMNLTLDNGEVYAVAGTLGTKTGNATYVGLSINESSMTKGIDNINDKQLEGTATTYGPYDNFYVYYFTRDCSNSRIKGLTNGNCYSITPDAIPVCSDTASPKVKCDSYLKIIQREYIVPGTQRGPDTTKILQPILLKYY